MLLALAPTSFGQQRFTIDAIGWSAVPPGGWTRVQGAALDAIRADLRQGPGAAEVAACWARSEPGALPRIVVTTTQGEIAGYEAARSLIESLGGDATTGELARFSLRAGLASFDGEVLVLTEGMVGSHGVVQLVAYCREPDLAETTGVLVGMAESSAFAKGHELAEGNSGSSSSRVVGWGVRGAVIGAMIAVIVFGVRMLRAMWLPAAESSDG